MDLTKYVACICEGAAEKAIMEILLDADKLIFKRDDLLEGELLRCRSGKNFEEQHLRKGFTEKITVLRILDSRREQFKLSKAYEHKIEVINVILLFLEPHFLPFDSGRNDGCEGFFVFADRLEAFAVPREA